MRGFRAWHTKLNRYLKDDEFYVDSDGSVYSSFETYDDEILEVDYIENFSRDDFNNGYIIREDDTGLKDKNGKEIYEGDIVQQGTISGGRFAVVKWIDANAKFIAMKIRNHRQVPFGSWTAKTELMVVGNIHENPELLEEEK